MPEKNMNTILRYPEKVKNTSDPYVIFSSHKAHYNAANKDINMNADNHIALYMPQSVTVSDSMRYENFSTGVVGALMESGFDTDNYSTEDIKALAHEYGPALAAGAAGIAFDSLLGAGAGAAISSKVNSEIQKSTQSVLNPREFALFRSPSMRQFAYNFTFIPESETESDTAMAIVKSFRQTMYPTVASVMTYKFPHVYTIQYVNADIIKIPEVALASASVVYNPNSMSYFKQNNRPVEIQLSLTFQELKPITSQLVADGY